MAFRSSRLHFTFVLKTAFEFRACQQNQPKECGCCYKVSFSEAGGGVAGRLSNCPRGGRAAGDDESAPNTVTHERAWQPAHTRLQRAREEGDVLFFTFIEKEIRTGH